MRLTHISLKPPFVSRDKPIEGPTVWYGADLAPADVEYRHASLCLNVAGFTLHAVRNIRCAAAVSPCCGTAPVDRRSSACRCSTGLCSDKEVSLV